MLVRVFVVIVVAAVAMVGGGWATRSLIRAGHWSAGQSNTEAATVDESEQWYTCGMHPNVLQKEPGLCPIRQMNLTPLKTESADEDGAGGARQRNVLFWRAPMNPNYVSKQPGKSPMGMDLVPVYADADQSTSAHTIRIDPVTIQNMGIRTATITRGPLVKTIRTLGRVEYDERRVTFVDTKFSGWIESLFVDQTGQPVAKGERLFEVYSPELYAAQQEYVSALDGLERLVPSTIEYARDDAVKLVEAAMTKLRYLDVSDGQIDRLGDTRQIGKTLAIHSPAEGIVTEKMALEGMYVKPGMRLYTIADLTRVWVYVDIYEYQLPWIRVGQEASITLPYVPGRAFHGQVVYIYPYLERQTRVIKVRLEFENPTLELKPGMFANVKLESELQGDAVLVPREAYIDSGIRQVVFVVRGGGKFSPRDIQVGVEAENGMVEVLYGLDEGEVVVTSGQFMLDAESKLKEAVAKMMEVERATTTKRSPKTDGDTPADDPSTDPPSETSTIPSDATHACPMDEHPDETDPAKQGPFFAGEPGRCPWCGMKLAPLDELKWVRVARAAEGGDVAYTCPDHQHVFSETDATCPRCGRELVPFKVLYTCPDPEHAGVIALSSGNCPHCGRGLAGYRGLWLDEAMADQNLPPDPALADAAAYRCTIHPLVHSEGPGQCTICAAALASTAPMDTEPAALQIPEGAAYTCPMKECRHFAEQPGECPVCGMDLRPLEKVGWAKEMLAARPAPAAPDSYLCPMHAGEAPGIEPGRCPICGMHLVREKTFQRPAGAPALVAAQMNYILEHYLELQRLLASDRTVDVARQALGLAAASEELGRHLDDPAVDLPPEVKAAASSLHKAALKTTGADLEADRVTFVVLSAAVRTLVRHARPDRDRWPKLYIYHCPMSKGDWLQASEEKANPYYGFKMLKCGQLKAVD
ncbi:MAG: efflux RND transporter periplasmic adaptor subunit [Planctomycetes bacterium]|nr:efflux RND transporter periplasmic adaptor subunit [Planctomycetota bacterium]